MTKAVTHFERITKEECQPFIMQRHYAKRIPSISWAFGAFVDGALQGCCTFGMPASPFVSLGVCGAEYSSRVYELNRLALNSGCPTNTASSIISYSAKEIAKIKGLTIIVSYADTEVGHVGYVYQAVNWLYTGATKERTDIAVEPGKHARHYIKSPTGEYVNRINRSSKHRYVGFYGPKRDVRDAKRSLQWETYPYPKGDSSKTPGVDVTYLSFDFNN